MSLEQALTENTLAINSLRDVWQQLMEAGKAAQGNVAKGSGLTAGGKTVIPAAEIGETLGTAATKKTAADQATSAAATASSKLEKESPAVTRAEMSVAIVSLAAKHGRPHALEVLAPFGVTAGRDVKDEDIAAVHAAATAALAADKTEDMS